MRYLLLGVFAVMVAGCSGPSAPLEAPPVSVSATSASFVHLEPGGFAIRGEGDTAVNFDLVPTLSIKNDSNAALHLIAIWELWSTASTAPIQVIKPNETPSITSGYDFRDTLDLGLVPAGASIPMDSIPMVTFSDSDLKNGKLRYSLSIESPDGRLMAWETDNLPPFIGPLGGTFDSVPFASRWHGILHTVESSPTVIDTIDRPDDGDWINSGILAIKPSVPNPAVGATTVQFTLLQAADSLRLLLDETPHHTLRAVSLGSLQAGAYIQQLDLTGISPGLYRTFLIAHKNGVVSQIRGDIMIPLH